MSSILKALKKLESEKSHHRQEQLGIDAKILQDGVSGRFSRSAVSLIAVALFVCGSGATYFYLKHDAADEIVPHSISSQTEKRSQSLASGIVSPTLKGGTVRSASSPLVSAKKVSASPDVQKHSTLSESARQSAKTSQPIQDGKLVEITPKPVHLPAPSPAAAAGTGTRPTLTINGIAYQDGGSDNLAVINGVTVSSGTVIEGVKVEEIQKDRVRFSQGGEKFEIILNKSNR
jgi:hypothetical protein